MLNDEYYLWGAGTYGDRIIDFMKGDLTFKAVIDNDPKKQGAVFHGLPVISYEEAKKDISKVKIVVALALPGEMRRFLVNEGFVQNQDFFLSYQFLSRYYWEKNRLVIANLNVVATTNCNMICKSCHSHMFIAKNHLNYSADTIKNNFDLLFSYADSVLNINFSCGESLLNRQAVADACAYINRNYADRYYVLAVVTNGSIIPEDDIMRSFSESKIILSISDYPEHVQSKSKLIEKCDKFNVSWLNNITCVQENWFDLGDPRIVSEEASEKLRKQGCWTPGVGLYDGWLYLCSAQSSSHAVAGVGTCEAGDAFDLSQPKTEFGREEIYRIISAQPQLGYISHCLRCNGTTTKNEV